MTVTVTSYTTAPADGRLAADASPGSEGGRAHVTDDDEARVAALDMDPLPLTALLANTHVYLRNKCILSTMRLRLRTIIEKIDGTRE